MEGEPRVLGGRPLARQAGLLITAHQPMGLPPLFATQPTLPLARQLVAELLGGTTTDPLTDDDIFTGGKYGKLSPPKPLPKGYESGLPGVRLVTVNGLLITTDEFGRFHVPCAALPKSNGSNFTLKLDTRTLPLGYQVTTENPRVLRLTPGKVAKMNFGAAPANQVDITLTAEAFDGDLPSSGLRQAITNLVTRMQETPTALRLAYLLGAQESVEQGMSRLKSVESAIRKAWRAVGGYELSISREVLRKKDK